MMDQELIKTVNKLQDTFSAANVPCPLDLPQIVVIGSQSSGKSSVLEHIVGRDFLPRGSGIVTRRPLVLQLINRPGRRPSQTANPAHAPNAATDGSDALADDLKRKASLSSTPNTEEEWGEFLHKPGKKLYNFEEIREEIVAETDRVTGGSEAKCVSAEPINLRIYSPHVLTLTLVDLPGLTKVPVGNQPKDIERQIRDMIMRFIVKPGTIVLAVTAANTDIANSDGLKLAREVDPDGLRTLGVLTKVDIMDKGTDVMDILSGKIIPLRLGYVPVVLRGQKDIETRKSIRAALENERDYFGSHPVYSARAAFVGTPHLASKLSKLLQHHVRMELPKLKAELTKNQIKFSGELAQLGDIAEGSFQNMLLSIINDFTTDFRNILDGHSQDMSTSELNGGARISFVFYEIFAKAIAAMDPFDQVSENDIRTLLYNSSGSTPAIFVATSAFEVLIKQQIRRLEDPSLKCVSLVYEELVRILTQLLNKPIFKRFPQLKEKFYTTVLMFIKRGMEPTNEFVRKFIQAETYFINSAHPNFISGHKAMALVYERLHPKEQPGGRQPVANAPSQLDPKTGRPLNLSLSSPVAPSPAAPMHAGGSKEEEGGVFGNFLGLMGQGKARPQRKPGVLEAPPPVLKASGSVSEKEFAEIEVIKMLLGSYFDIVKQSTADLVPKYIMANLVKYAREELQQGMLAELYREDLMVELLKENPDVVQRRHEVKRMLVALQRAEEIINTV